MEEGGMHNPFSFTISDTLALHLGVSIQGHLSWGEGRFLASIAQTQNQESVWRLPLVVRWRHYTVRA